MKRFIWTMIGLAGTRWAMRAMRNRSQSRRLDDKVHDLQNKFKPLDEIPTPETPVRYGT